MTTKVILLTGLGAASTADGIREWMRRFGPVVHVDFVRDGNAAAPLAVVEMEVSEAQAFFIVSRLTNYWHEGSLVSARLMVH
ncbi:MAG TPA: RNA-binding protein [Rhodocyclaceae bacterium]